MRVYLLSALILIGVIIALLVICFGIAFLLAKISDLDVHFDCAYGRYHRFRDKMTKYVLPCTVVIIMGSGFIMGLAMVYMKIIEWLR